MDGVTSIAHNIGVLQGAQSIERGSSVSDVMQEGVGGSGLQEALINIYE